MKPMSDAGGSTATTDPWADCMRRGDFAGAWEISDAVLATHRGVPCWHRPRHEQYVWDGTPLAHQRVLVRCYHGLGDTVQFIRYAPLVRAVAREVIVWAQPALLPLLRTAAGIDRLLPLHDGTPDVDYDVDVELMELPHVFRTTLATIPAAVPYLHAKPAVRERDAALHVGLVWSAGDWDRRRAVPMALLEPLREIRGVRWHALQRGPALAAWPPHLGAISGRDRPEEAAAVMRALDLVISVDSFPAHLAGALGVPTWTLLHTDADWRWMRDRDDTPWYPSMRLFRQQRAGDWTDVLATVASELLRLRAVRLNAASGVSPAQEVGAGLMGGCVRG
jgi:hypothetical protein